MVKELQFSTNNHLTPNDESIQKYFLSEGFRLVKIANATLFFKKGNILRNFIAVNPLNWKSTIIVKLSGETVYLTANIRTFGQFVTKTEEQFWDRFLNNFQFSLVKGADFTSTNQELVRNAVQYNLRLIFKTLAIAVLVIAVLEYLKYSTR